MKAMILAAGKGTRMRPLTDNCPKPLLLVQDKPLIEWHLQRLANAGIDEVVINCAYLGHHIEQYIEVREDDGLKITVIHEGEMPLETAGGIVNALPVLTDGELDDTPFLVVNGDVWMDLDYRRLVELAKQQRASGTLVLVSNPEHNPEGDFSLSTDGMLLNRDDQLMNYTYSGVSVFRPSLFDGLDNSVGALGAYLRRWADQSRLAATLYGGYWLDVGTPERLALLEQHLLSGSLKSEPQAASVSSGGFGG